MVNIGPISIHRNRKVLAPAESPPQGSYTEIGGTGTTAYGGIILTEYNPDLRGLRGIQTYDKMRKNDAKVRATLRLVKSPILSAQWYMDPASNSDEDKYIA